MLIHAYYRAQKIKERKNDTSTRGTSYEDKEEFQVQIKVSTANKKKHFRQIGRYLRIRVELDVTKPLRRGAVLKFGDKGIEDWFPFQYERLPNFCYICGRLEHVERDCVEEGPDGKKSGYESSLRAPGGRSFGNRPSSFSSTQASSGSGGGGASGAMKGLSKEAISSNRNNSGEASRASSTKGTKNLEDAEVTNPVGRSATRRLILDPSAKRRILEELQSEVRDMLTPAGMKDAERTGDDADAGSPWNTVGVQPKAALEAVVTSQEGVSSPRPARIRKKSFKPRTLEYHGPIVEGSHKMLSKKRKKVRAEEGAGVEAGCLEDFMEVEIKERMLKKPCSGPVGVEIIMTGSAVQTHPEP
ncbi:hypothetical protein Drorol1_Dr00019332 [Drosera rotundifolia]